MLNINERLGNNPSYSSYTNQIQLILEYVQEMNLTIEIIHENLRTARRDETLVGQKPNR